MMHGAPIDPVTLMPLANTLSSQEEQPSRDFLIDFLAVAGSEAGQRIMDEIVKMLELRVYELVEADPQARALMQVITRLDQKASGAVIAYQSLIASRTRGWQTAVEMGR